MTKGECYDFVFLQSNLPIRNDGYVYKHIKYLSEELNRRGYRTAVLVLPQSAFLILLRKLQNHLVNLKYFIKQTLLNLIFVNMKVYNFSRAFLNNTFDTRLPFLCPTVKYHFLDENIMRHSKRVVMNEWEVAHYLETCAESLAGYYIVYHNHELDFPKLGELVANTYDSGFRKLVTTNCMKDKFSLPDECKIIPALDQGKVATSRHDKIQNTVLIPLRTGNIKGADYAIKAIQYVLNKNKNIIFNCFGDLEYNSDNDRVISWGKITDKKLVELYSTCEIFVLPSVEDGLPGPALEAMLNGCAVICTEVSGARELIDDRVNGIIVPVKDERALAEAILELNRNKLLINEYSNRGLEMKNRYTVENMTNSFLYAISIYEKRNIQDLEGRTT